MTKHRSRSRERSTSRGRHSKDRKHSKKHRSRSSSLSENDSVTFVENKPFDERLKKLREKTRGERQIEKQKLKERETPEEKRARRMAKKIQKEEKRRAESTAALPETIPYTDLNNPFNDSNLTSTFVWNKKLEVEGKSSLSKREIEKISRERIHKNVREMEELKKNRDARQAAKDDMEMIARDQERSKNSDWRRTEDTFHLQQAKLRSQLRVKEGRAKPIDLLARYVAFSDDGAKDFGDFELVDPLNYLKNCSFDDYEDLTADIKVYRVISGTKHSEFWDDIETLANTELKKISDARRRDENVHTSVQSDIARIIKGKKYDELAQLEQQIMAKVRNAGRGVDVAYWESLLESLRPQMAKCRINERHKEVVKLEVQRMREAQKKETEKYERENEMKPVIKMEEGETSLDMKPTKTASEREEEEAINDEEELQRIQNAKPLPFTIDDLEGLDDDVKEQKWSSLDEQQLRRFTLEMYRQGNYSPSFSDERQAMPGIDILDGPEDAKSLLERREQHKQNTMADGGMSAKEAQLMEMAQRGMGSDESVFSVEEQLGEQSFLWSDKYRPRKPRYYNRVHTGFDWNKYNQTHYDIDNPPPKIVQGYRFNIFYPDLLDSSKTPTFKLMECEDPDFATLRFKAGPPYEDIAFKIVNREWEVNHKHGYKCQFQNGVFQLWFFFKRYRYRR